MFHAADFLLIRTAKDQRQVGNIAGSKSSVEHFTAVGEIISSVAYLSYFILALKEFCSAIETSMRV